MDFAKIIREKRDELRQLQEVDGLDPVLRHLESAEKHFNNGRDEGDAELFTDVIYRANQVFEGILEEAFQVITRNDATKKTPAEIEDYFSKNNVFRPRVLEYFTRYRTEWRNAATHDHRLDFDEQEAFLAYSTVCGFCFCALNQMLQTLASQQAALGRVVKKDQFGAAPIADLLITDFPALFGRLQSTASAAGNYIRISEATLVGSVEGLIKSTLRNVDTSVEPLLTLGDRRLRIDLLVSHENERVAIEVKGSGSEIPKVIKEQLKEQLATYSDAAQATGAVGIIFPSTGLKTQKFVFEKQSVEGASIPTFLVLPKIVKT